VVVYDAATSEAARNQPVVAFLFDLSYKRRIFEVLLDTILIVLSYYFAFTLLYGRPSDGAIRETFLRIIPALVAVKLVTFLTLGVYRGLWRYFSIENLVTYAKAALCGSAAVAIVALIAFRFQGLSRAVFALDALLTFAFLSGTRITFRMLRSVLSPSPVNATDGRRVLIYGAGDGGELLLRELRNNSALRCNLVGFVDDDPLKTNKTIHGYRVFGGNGQLPKIIAEHQIDEIIISSAKFNDLRLQELRQQCDGSVLLKRLSIRVEPLFSGDDSG
jgi:UDP-GlcNAc:undecaprenyl-phosphate GlcNAc-1-phosphate transferase